MQQKRSFIQSIKDCWYLAKPYWASEDKYKAIGLVSVVITLNLLSVYVSVLFNKWNNKFYDAIQKFDKESFYHLLVQFTYYAFTAIALAVFAYWVRKMLEIRWRKWITQYYIANWLDEYAYYKTRFITDYADNPDQRISQDLSAFIVTVLDLTLGFISNLVSLFSFVFILYSLSGPLVFSLFGEKFSLSGYMVWVALAYAAIGTLITFILGRPLIKLNYQQENVEADFRFGLMRVREYSESIAFYNGEKQEKISLNNKFNSVIANFLAIVYRQMKLDVFNVGYSQLAIIFPILVAAPRYFAKQIQLGDLMQIASAFGRVQDALSFFINSYGSLASLRAIMDRMYGFQVSIDSAKELPVIKVSPLSNLHSIKVDNLTLFLPDHSILHENIAFTLNSGNRILIKGNSGSGKTTLLRTIAGLWPYASGALAKNLTSQEMFIGQRAYVPDTTLEEALFYPKPIDTGKLAELHEILNQVGLARLLESLMIKNDWSKILSLGEQQRLAFARILINKPEIIYLDEATSAVDEAMEEVLYGLLLTQLPQSIIISVGHRSTLAKWHGLVYDFNDKEIA